MRNPNSVVANYPASPQSLSQTHQFKANQSLTSWKWWWQRSHLSRVLPQQRREIVGSIFWNRVRRSIYFWQIKRKKPNSKTQSLWSKLIQLRQGRDRGVRAALLWQNQQGSLKWRCVARKQRKSGWVEGRDRSGNRCKSGVETYFENATILKNR